jgi:hypothetical protein
MSELPNIEENELYNIPGFNESVAESPFMSALADVDHARIELFETINDQAHNPSSKVTIDDITTLFTVSIRAFDQLVESINDDPDNDISSKQSLIANLIADDAVLNASNINMITRYEILQYTHKELIRELEEVLDNIYEECSDSPEEVHQRIMSVYVSFTQDKINILLNNLPSPEQTRIQKIANKLGKHSLDVLKITIATAAGILIAGIIKRK